MVMFSEEDWILFSNQSIHALTLRNNQFMYWNGGFSPDNHPVSFFPSEGSTAKLGFASAQRGLIGFAIFSSFVTTSRRVLRRIGLRDRPSLKSSHSRSGTRRESYVERP